MFERSFVWIEIFRALATSFTTPSTSLLCYSRWQGRNGKFFSGNNRHQHAKRTRSFPRMHNFCRGSIVRYTSVKLDPWENLRCLARDWKFTLILTRFARYCVLPLLTSLLVQTVWWGLHNFIFSLVLPAWQPIFIQRVIHWKDRAKTLVGNFYPTNC